MRNLVKNQQVVYISTYKSKTALKDSYGNETGEYQIKYNTPVKKAWNVSYADSDAEVAMFGIESSNTLRIVADEIPSDTSILWYGKTPRVSFVDYAPDHNYIVVGILPSLNESVFYARKINTVNAVVV